jgi:hypothetical protein
MNDWLGIERHSISRKTAIIVAIAAVIIIVVTAAIAVWMHTMTRPG